jgi:DNA-binding MarR family transcriptional regulator
MRRAVSIVQSDYARTLSELNLRAVSFSALSIIAAEPGLTQTQLADALQIERSNLVTNIDELANRKLIVRSVVVRDRRRYSLEPTETGKELAAIAQAKVADQESRLFACLTAAERQDLLRILRKFRQSSSA